MESGEGMAISEFSYPLFQAYDWWDMYKNKGVQLQIGGSDQYGNLCAGMDAVSQMQKIDTNFGRPENGYLWPHDATAHNCLWREVR
jgi:tyrosyl-tRNA synthetase